LHLPYTYPATLLSPSSALCRPKHPFTRNLHFAQICGPLDYTYTCATLEKALRSRSQRLTLFF
jgi:hypothetical protein